MSQPTDSGEDTGSAGVPTPKLSGNSSDQRSSEGGSFDVESFKKSILDSLGPEIDKRFQSTKDKRFKAVEQLGDLMPTMQTFKEYLEAAGGDVKKASREMALDQMLSSPGAGGPSPKADLPTKSDDSYNLQRLQNETADILTEAGISNDDPELADLAKGDYKSPAEWYKAVAKLGVARVKGGTANPGVPVNDSGGRAPVVTDRAGKLDKLYAEMSSLNRDPTTNRTKLGKVKDEIRKLGGDI